MQSISSTFAAGAVQRAPVAQRARRAVCARAVPGPVESKKVDKYAVVEIGGSQLIVEEGRYYSVNRLGVEEGATIQMGRVLGVKNNGDFKVGQPYVEGATVQAEILGDEKGPKITVYKMKPKKHTRSKNGHRQPLTKFLVTKIEG
ncbi:unnamed protein product [Pedinophyceae sp. YPF-701]|nr:unnamed protein product [Pedinophyceae sp. YPF-701]